MEFNTIPSVLNWIQIQQLELNTIPLGNIPVALGEVSPEIVKLHVLYSRVNLI